MSGSQVVCLRALGLGDLLTAVPALRGLRRAFPDRRILLAAPASLRWVADASGAVDAVVGTPFGAGIDPRMAPATDAGTDSRTNEENATPPPLPDSLRHPVVAVNLHGRGPQSHRLLQALRPERLIAFRHPLVHPGPDATETPEWDDDEHEVQRWCRLLRRHDVPADPGDLDLVAPPVTLPATYRGATVIHPGASTGARRWPVARWAVVARAERERGREVLLTGATRERRLCRTVAQLADLDARAVLAGRTDLPTLAAVVAGAGRLVSGDTGVQHLATALGTPSLILFGPVSPAVWGPPHDRPWHRPLWAGRAGDPHASEPSPGLLAITPDDVLEALATLPEAPRPHGAPRGGPGDADVTTR